MQNTAEKMGYEVIKIQVFGEIKKQLQKYWKIFQKIKKHV